MLQTDKIYQGDCLGLIKQVDDASVDCILTDPPYLYLDGCECEFDKSFDEDALFAEWKRVLKPKGMIVFFGRGESFYRWNVKLNTLGFPFKEEVIWDKISHSSPVTPISRVHETISILGKGKIKTTYIPSKEYYETDLKSLERDIHSVKVALKNPKHLQELLEFVQAIEAETEGIYHSGEDAHAPTNEEYPIKERHKKNRRDFYTRERKSKYNITVKGMNKNYTRHIGFLLHTMRVKERSVISVMERKDQRVHPTMKPVRLLERLLLLVSDRGDVVLDCFSGSGSTAVACQNTGRHFIGFEIDEKYYKDSLKRISMNNKLF